MKVNFDDKKSNVSREKIHDCQKPTKHFDIMQSGLKVFCGLHDACHLGLEYSSALSCSQMV